MTAGWVASSTRGQALLQGLVGSEGALQLATADSWPQARSLLINTMYGNSVASEADRRMARTAVFTGMAWQLRVLAGWLPVGGSGLARLFAAPMELANIEAHLATLEDGSNSKAIPLGSLAVAWPRVAKATSAEQVRRVLAHSAWGDPGGVSREAMAVGLRVAWARRLIAQASETVEWAKGGLAVLIAREVFAFARTPNPTTGRVLDRLLGNRWHQATSIPDLADRLPEAARWVLEDLTDPEELWLAELAIIERVASDATAMAASSRFSRLTVTGIMALLMVDLWRVNSAIEVVGRGPNPMEVFHAVA